MNLQASLGQINRRAHPSHATADDQYSTHRLFTHDGKSP
jgi:hypothetical protein